MIALYHWHPHELPALLWGTVAGIILGWQFHRTWLAVKKWKGRA